MSELASQMLELSEEDVRSAGNLKVQLEEARV